jgi:hypothetical protein
MAYADWQLAIDCMAVQIKADRPLSAEETLALADQHRTEMERTAEIYALAEDAGYTDLCAKITALED